MDEFDWNDANEDHIARHGVTRKEAEEAYLDPNKRGVSIAKRATEPRWAVLGKTENGRILYLIYTLRQEYVRIITAYDAGQSEKKYYKRK